MNWFRESKEDKEGRLKWARMKQENEALFEKALGAREKLFSAMREAREKKVIDAQLRNRNLNDPNRAEREATRKRQEH